VLKTIINSDIISIKDTYSLILTPEIKIGNDWVSITPDSYEAHLEEDAGTSLQELTVIDLGNNEYRIDFYADDSIFDIEPLEETIEVNKKFFVAFYWEYMTVKKTERLQVRIVAVN